MKLLVAGHGGMVGSAIVRAAGSSGNEVLVLDRSIDLRCQQSVQKEIEKLSPDAVVIAAAKVGGIHANNEYSADFIYDNLMIEANLIQSSFDSGCQRLLFLGSSCIYPKFAEQPMQESSPLTGMLEPTNEPYAIAKIAGIKLCECYNRQHGTDYRSVMPTNLYGIGDNFYPENSHFIPALMRRIHEAKVNGAPEIVVWGSGKAMREFLHVDDLADACMHVLSIEKARLDAAVDPMCSHINVGTGEDVTIRILAETITKVVGYEGNLTFDTSKPDGTPRKLLDVSKLSALGWQAKIGLEEGLRSTYQWFLDNQDALRT